MPWHVTQGPDIVLGDVRYGPSYFSIDDIVCYGGLPKFSSVRDANEVYINLEVCSVGSFWEAKGSSVLEPMFRTWLDGYEIMPWGILVLGSCLMLIVPYGHYYSQSSVYMLFGNLWGPLTFRIWMQS
jgi:hypothetical protein